MFDVKIGVVFAIAILSACRPEMPSTAPPHRTTTFEEFQRAQWLAGRPLPCRALRDVMLKDAGAAAHSCSDSRTNSEAFACAERSFARRQPFTLCNSGFGMDSVIENGVAGLPNGNLAIYYWDSMGPQTRGICLRPNVSIATDDWPLCRTALADRTNLRSGQPEHEFVSPAEEPWPPSCSAIVPRAPTEGVRIHLISGDNVLPDYERWGLRCRDAVAFEMLIAKDGSVKCARVRGVGLRPRNPARDDVIRSRLMRWRFEPPTIHGQPVEARWGMQINSMRKGDRPLPGPQIYPFCP